MRGDPRPVEDVSNEALRRHAATRGKIQVLPKCGALSPEDFAIWYTPGVAAASRAIHDDPSRVYELTNKGNSVAIVSNGTRVLGLGNIGPEAALPVMEGKALLFKVLGGVDAYPICVRTQDPAELIRAVQLIEPSFGGINLEDISQPECFHVLAELRKSMGIPVWHDDQQGTAAAVVAGLVNALALTRRRIGNTRIAMIGMGAANVAAYRLLKACGADPAAIIACDSVGVLHSRRADIEAQSARFPDKWAVCNESNPQGVTGGIAEALRGADVCIAFSRSGPGVIRPGWVKAMARDAIVFACANPVPEIWPAEARAAGARIVATGRSDFPNQLNNSLVFPAVFRGTFDSGARAISDDMALAAAHELARCAADKGLRDEAILPLMSDWEAVPRVAAAVALKAQEEGLSSRHLGREQYVASATHRIRLARETAAATCPVSGPSE